MNERNIIPDAQINCPTKLNAVQDEQDKEKKQVETAEENLTSRELDDVTTVFRQFETGLREGCISVKVPLIYKI